MTCEVMRKRARSGLIMMINFPPLPPWPPCPRPPWIASSTFLFLPPRIFRGGIFFQVLYNRKVLIFAWEGERERGSPPLPIRARAYRQGGAPSLPLSLPSENQNLPII